MVPASTDCTILTPSSIPPPYCVGWGRGWEPPAHTRLLTPSHACTLPVTPHPPPYHATCGVPASRAPSASLYRAAAVTRHAPLRPSSSLRRSAPRGKTRRPADEGGTVRDGMGREVRWAGLCWVRLGRAGTGRGRGWVRWGFFVWEAITSPSSLSSRATCASRCAVRRAVIRAVALRTLSSACSVALRTFDSAICTVSL